MSQIARLVDLERLDQERGPDVSHSLKVPSEWFEEGATVEFWLPRVLPCAHCEGGGCDKCGRSGGVATRGRKEPEECVELTLPDAPEGKGVMVRLPERGGLPLSSQECTMRGHLLLQLRLADEASDGVSRVEVLAPAPPSRRLKRRNKGSTKPRLPQLAAVDAKLNPAVVLGLLLALAGVIWLIGRNF